ncbi:MAG: hypothetical protein K9J30_12660 [Bacteroidales bacterium]|nr:hypothetical protein [Bacteroidales bacterium]
MKRILIAIVSLLVIQTSNAQNWRQRMDSLNKVSHQEHRLMLQRLGIEELRPGPSGNPDDPNAANSDESKAKTYVSLPDPLVFENGSKVKNKADWEMRRDEIIALFEKEMYGKVPDNVPGVTWKIISEKDTLIGNIPAVERKLEGIVDNSGFPDIEVAIDLTIGFPVKVREPVPVIVEFGWNFPGNWGRQPEGPTWKEQLLEKGWGYAILVPTSVQADNGAGLKQGIIGLANKGNVRKPGDWGALRAWAWGASRAMDYFESNKDIDASRIGIEGLSRYGKAAIVTMAFDPRFAIGFIGSSGAGGAKILRRNFGEQVENLASSAEYHWFAPEFVKYAGPLTVNDLPVDAHHLIALCAPRPVFISTGDPKVEGNWVDAKGMFLAGVHAGTVYELLGKKGLDTDEYPGTGVMLDGDIAFRQHEGGHTVVPNWPWFISYAKKYFEQ